MENQMSTSKIKTAPQARGKMVNLKDHNLPSFYDEIMKDASEVFPDVLTACEIIVTTCGITDRKAALIADQLCNAAQFMMKYPRDDWHSAQDDRIAKEQDKDDDPSAFEAACRKEEDFYAIYKALELFHTAAKETYHATTGEEWVPKQMRSPKEYNRPRIARRA